MVLIAEFLVALALISLAVRWYLHTPLHRARKTSHLMPPQVAGHMGFGMYTPSNPPLIPRALHDYRKAGSETDAPAAGRQAQSRDA